jgi:hypothetical protein
MTVRKTMPCNENEHEHEHAHECQTNNEQQPTQPLNTTPTTNTPPLPQTILPADTPLFESALALVNSFVYATHT